MAILRMFPMLDNFAIQAKKGDSKLRVDSEAPRFGMLRLVNAFNASDTTLKSSRLYKQAPIRLTPF